MWPTVVIMPALRKGDPPSFAAVLKAGPELIGAARYVEAFLRCVCIPATRHAEGGGNTAPTGVRCLTSCSSAPSGNAEHCQDC